MWCTGRHVPCNVKRCRLAAATGSRGYRPKLHEEKSTLNGWCFWCYGQTKWRIKCNMLLHGIDMPCWFVDLKSDRCEFYHFAIISKLPKMPKLPRHSEACGRNCSAGGLVPLYEGFEGLWSNYHCSCWRFSRFLQGKEGHSEYIVAMTRVLFWEWHYPIHGFRGSSHCFAKVPQTST